MKKVALIFLIFVSFTGEAQEDIFSFYFKKNAILVLNSVSNVNPLLFGAYEPVDSPENEVRRAAGEYMKVDETGIYLEKNRLLSIPKEEVRENSKYTVRNGWLHGVVDNDSLACALDGDKYFFLTPVKNYLFENGTPPNRLIQISQSKYALFSIEENGYFSCIVANFLPGRIQLYDVSLSFKDPNNVEKIAEKEEELTTDDGIKTFILTPTKDEWMSFVFSNCLEEYDAYSRVAQ